jgi:hypothetical protein
MSKKVAAAVSHHDREVVKWWGERYTTTNANPCAARIFKFIVSKIPPKLPSQEHVCP